MTKEEIKTSCDKAQAFIPKLHDRLNKIAEEYEVLSRGVAGSHNLTELRKQFTTFKAEVSGYESRAYKVMKYAENIAEYADKSAYVEERSNGTPQGDCKYKAFLRSADERLTFNLADINHHEIRSIMYSAQSFIDLLAQEISVVKVEEFNMRQPD